jgi:hypothetical protein
MHFFYHAFGHLSYQFFAPAILDDGWVVYMWDMRSRVIHVLDPLAGPKGPNIERKELLELAASTLHDALFACFNEFFAGWPKTKELWHTEYPKIVDTIFSK